MRKALVAFTIFALMYTFGFSQEKTTYEKVDSQIVKVFFNVNKTELLKRLYAQRNSILNATIIEEAQLKELQDNLAAIDKEISDVENMK